MNLFTFVCMRRLKTWELNNDENTLALIRKNWRDMAQDRTRTKITILRRAIELH